MKTAIRASMLLVLLTSAPEALAQTATNLRGGMTCRAFDVTFADGTRLRISTCWTADGKIEQFILAPAG